MNLLEGLCLELRNISFNYLRKLETHWNYLKRGKNWTQRGTDLWIDQVHDKMTFDWRLRLAKSCHIDLLLATTNCTVMQYNKLEIDYKMIMSGNFFHYQFLLHLTVLENKLLRRNVVQICFKLQKHFSKFVLTTLYLSKLV